MSDFEFENDFGQTPLFMGRVTKDQAVIGISSAIAAFAGCAIGGIPLAIVVLAAGINDILAADKPQLKRVPPVIDTKAQSVEEPPEEQGYPRNDSEYSNYSSEPSSCYRDATEERRRETPQPTTEEPVNTNWTWTGTREEVQETAMKRGQKKTQFTPQLPQVTNRAKRELIERLKKECPGLLRLVKSHPARFVGKQRTGKSTMAKIVCLLRMVLLEGHQVIASTPHYEPANPYPSVFKVVGITPTGQRDYEAIQREWRGLARRVHDCRINSNTTVWDEFGLFDQVMEEDEIKSVLTSCLRETMKFGEYPIFIVHGETAAFLPGSKGLVTVFLNGTVRVETIGELVEDEDGLETIKPTGKFHITWLDGSQESGQIPEWLTEKYLLSLLGDPVVDRKPLEEEYAPMLQEPLKTIYSFAKEQNEWVTVREIQRKDFAVLKGKGAKNIRQYLGLLADSGLGEIEEEGKSDSAVRFLAK